MQRTVRGRGIITASDAAQVDSNNENPDWTAEDFARARPIAEFPGLARAFPNGGKPRGRPKGSTTSGKSQVTLRLDTDIIERFKADGPGWQSGMNAALRAAVTTSS
jgi:uncharacterized protein (DUF4415 family)